MRWVIHSRVYRVSRIHGNYGIGEFSENFTSFVKNLEISVNFMSYLKYTNFDPRFIKIVPFSEKTYFFFQLSGNGHEQSPDFLKILRAGEFLQIRQH